MVSPSLSILTPLVGSFYLNCMLKTLKKCNSSLNCSPIQDSYIQLPSRTSLLGCLIILSIQCPIQGMHLLIPKSAIFLFIWRLLTSSFQLLRSKKLLSILNSSLPLIPHIHPQLRLSLPENYIWDMTLNTSTCHCQSTVMSHP